MNAKLNTDPQYDQLIETLIEKTKDGKINWEETAEPGSYVAAVKGERSFEIRAWGGGAMFVLTVKNKQGEEVLSTPNSLSALAGELYTLARRVAERLDEQIDTTLEVLRTL